MDKETIKQEISYQTTIKTHLWTGLLVTASGTLSLLLNLDSIPKSVLFTFGAILSISILNDYFNKTILIRSLLNNLENIKND